MKDLICVALILAAAFASTFLIVQWFGLLPEEGVIRWLEGLRAVHPGWLMAGVVALLQVASVHFVSRSRYPMNYNVLKMLGLPVWGALNYVLITAAVDGIWLQSASMLAANAAAVAILFGREFRHLLR